MARVMSPVGLGSEDPVQVDFFLLSVLVSAVVLISFPLLFFDGLDEKNRARASTPLGSVPPSCLYSLPTCCSSLFPLSLWNL